MDWLNLHVSVLDSPQVLRCDPVRRATWLFLLRYCISQENGGVIGDCADWGDTTWQQIVRVKMREVRAESPLWTWEGNSLRVTFYPTEKESEVRAKRELARTNGQRGGRPKRTDSGSQPETDSKPTSVISPKAEGNGMEWKGKEVSPAAASFVVPEKSALIKAAAADLGFMDEMQPAPPAREFSPRADWTLWRQTHPRLYIGRSDEDGCVDDWRALFDRAEAEIMDVMYASVVKTLANPKHGVGFRAAVDWINKNTEPA